MSPLVRRIALSCAVALLCANAPLSVQRALASPSPKPATDPCPLHAVQFSLAGQGSTGHIDRYVVGLMLTGKDPVTASLQIPGLDEALLTPVIGADPQGRSLLVHYVVDMPRAAGAQSVRVLGILLHGATEREVTCRSPQRLVQTVPGTQTRFDDATLPGSDMLYLRQVTEARVVRSSAAIFPASAAKRARAPAVVVVTVGAQGAVLAERIESTSGDAELDSSALTAAKHTVFTEPQFDGEPIALDYVLTYNFGP